MDKKNALERHDLKIYFINCHIFSLVAVVGGRERQYGGVAWLAKVEENSEFDGNSQEGWSKWAKSFMDQLSQFMWA
jgi:hypothetical protein